MSGDEWFQQHLPWSVLEATDRPCFFYRIDLMQESLDFLRSECALYFSFANQPNPLVLEKLRGLSGIEVSNEHELAVLQKWGWEKRVAIFSGGTSFREDSTLEKPREKRVEFLFDQPVLQLGMTVGLHSRGARWMLKESSCKPGVYLADSASFKEVQKWFDDQWPEHIFWHCEESSQTDLLKLVEFCKQRGLGFSIVLGCSWFETFGFYAARVLSSSKKMGVVIDGGIQHFARPMYNAQQGLNRLRVLVLRERNVLSGHLPAQSRAVFGSLCIAKDCLHPRLELPPDLKRNDWLLIQAVGGNGPTSGYIFFIGESLPLEFTIDENGSLQSVTRENFKPYHVSF